ncbi:unnamed protein product, partial [Tuber aestivum]
MPCYDEHICTTCNCDNLADDISDSSIGVPCDDNLVEVTLTHDLVDGRVRSNSIGDLKLEGGVKTARLPKIIRNFSLVGKVCVVTGGARGLGYNMVEGFLQAGARGVAILDILETEGDAAAGALCKHYNTLVLFYKVDITNDESVEKVFSRICKDLGSIDVLLCAAGIADSNMPAETYSMTRFRRLMDINVNGLMKCSQEAGKQMIKQGTGGSIILVASMSSHIVNFPQEQCCYNASKAAVRHLGASLALEWSKYGIRVNSISPGYMDTELNRSPGLDAQKAIWCDRTPLKRLGHEDELNNLALFLASPASSFMTGADVIIDVKYRVDIVSLRHISPIHYSLTLFSFCCLVSFPYNFPTVAFTIPPTPPQFLRFRMWEPGWHVQIGGIKIRGGRET